ncbi:MAG: hypothetical protein AB7J28_15360 [Hyphomonadaceae bacterium]
MPPAEEEIAEEEAADAAAPAPAPTPEPAATPATPAAPARPSALAQLGVNPELLEALSGARAANAAAAAADEQRLQQTQQQREGLVSERLDIPEAPTLPELPEPPPQTVPANGMRVFGQFLPMLAMLGGSFARRDATAALRTGAAAMRAARANDVQELQLQHQHWEDQIERITADRSAMLEQYQAVLQNRSLSLTERNAQLAALAASEDNIIRRMQVRNGNIEQLASSVQMEASALNQISTQARMDRQLNETARHNQAMEAAAQQRAAAQANRSQFGADQRARAVTTYPSALEASALMDSMEAEGYRYSDDWGARMTEVIPWDSGSVARAAGGEDYTRYSSAASAFESAILPILSGAAVTPTEARRMVRAVLPQIGDSDEVLADKSRRRQQMLNGAAAIAGQAAPFPDLGTSPEMQAIIDRNNERNAAAERAGQTADIPRLSADPEEAEAQFDLLSPGDQFYDPQGVLREVPR